LPRHDAFLVVDRHYPAPHRRQPVRRDLGPVATHDPPRPPPLPLLTFRLSVRSRDWVVRVATATVTATTNSGCANDIFDRTRNRTATAPHSSHRGASLHSRLATLAERRKLRVPSRVSRGSLRSPLASRLFLRSSLASRATSRVRVETELYNYPSSACRVPDSAASWIASITRRSVTPSSPSGSISASARIAWAK
jgi:hypothetical protein